MLIIVRGTTGSFLHLAKTLPVVFKTKNRTLTRLLGSPTFALFRRREILVIKGHGPFPIIDLCTQLFPRWSWVFIIPFLQPLSVVSVGGMSRKNRSLMLVRISMGIQNFSNGRRNFSIRFSIVHALFQSVK